MSFDNFNIDTDSQNSIIENVILDNIQIGFFSFGGFRIIDSTRTGLFYMDLVNITTYNLRFKKAQDMIKFQIFENEEYGVIRILNSTFEKTEFLIEGNLLQFSMNTIYPLLVQNSVFKNNKKA